MKQKVKAFLREIIPARQRNQLFRLRRLMNRVYFYGWHYQCPICQSPLRTLLPFGNNTPVITERNIVGAGYRLNCQCPVCLSFERDRLLYLYLVKKTQLLTKPIKLLHIAPEIGLNSVLKKYPNIDYLTADLQLTSDAGVDVMVQMDITDIDYPDNSFDVIICNHVLEHIIEDRKAMGELYRVLKPGGWSILQVPRSLSLNKTYEDFSVNTPEEKEKAFGQYNHVRIYGRDYADKLMDSGFNIKEFKWWDDNLFSTLHHKHRFLEQETLILANKS